MRCLYAIAALALAATCTGASADEQKNSAVAVGRMAIAAAPAADNKIPRYKKRMVDALTEYDTGTCAQISPGAWSTDDKPKYGKVTTGTLTAQLANNICSGHTFTFATLNYEWTTHTNESDEDTFKATWKTPDGHLVGGIYDVTVPIVRPVGETSAFTGWADTRGLWEQTLKPPADDPDFDFTGETVKETSVGATDTCFDGKFPFGQATLTEHSWTVHDKVKWGADGVGWGANGGTLGQCAIEYYRCVRRAPCGSILLQQMQISSPADKGKFVNYGSINILSSFVEGGITPLNKMGIGDVTSQRGGAAGGALQKRFWPSFPTSCPANVKLSAC